MRRSLRGRLPFDGDSKEEVMSQVVYNNPDYGSRFFLRLSPSVGVRGGCEVVSRGDQGTAAEEPRHAAVGGGFDAPSVVRGDGAERAWRGGVGEGGEG